VLGPNWEEWMKPGITNYVASGDKPTDFGDRLNDLLNMSDDERAKLRSASWNYIKNNLLLSRVNYQRRGIFEKYMDK